MLYSLFEIGKTLSICILLDDYFTRIYSTKYKEITIEIIFKIIYVYSFCEMKIKNVIKNFEEKHPHIIKFIKQIFKHDLNKIDIEFVKDNQIVDIFSKQKYLNLKEEEVVVIPDYDFVLYSDTSVTPSNIKIIHKNSTSKFLINVQETYNYVPSTIRFILIEFVVGEKTYKIDLSTNKYNFYVKDNIFDRNFFLYYLRNIETEVVVFEDFELDEFTIKIIDNNVNINKIHLTKHDNQCIKLDESSYEIITKPV